MALKPVEAPEDVLVKIFFGRKMPVVRALPLGDAPDFFDRVQFWRVRGQIVKLDSVGVSGNPFLDSPGLMVPPIEKIGKPA